MATTKKSSTAKKSAPAKKTASAKKTAKKSAPAAKKAAAPKRAPAAKKAAPKKVAPKKVAPKKAAPKGSPATLAKKAVKKAPPPPPPPRSADEVRRDEAQALALALAAAALDKKAERIEIIDVYGKADYADFLVLMSGRVDRQVQAIAQAVEARAEERGQRARSVEGARQGQWVVVDFGDVVAHVFIEEERRNRDLESLWIDARRVPFHDAAAPAAAAT
ncbi:MAG: ribosome silencing factor [Polyangiales bacterium]